MLCTFMLEADSPQFIGCEVPQHPILKSLEDLPSRTKVIENDLLAVKYYIEDTVAKKKCSSNFICPFGVVALSVPESTLIRASLAIGVAALAYFAVKRNAA